MKFWLKSRWQGQQLQLSAIFFIANNKKKDEMLRDLKKQILDLERGGQKAVDFRRKFNSLVGGQEEEYELYRTLRFSRAESVAFSPDGKKVALAHLSRRVTLWDVASGERLQILGENMLSGIVAFSFDGSKLAGVLPYDGKIKIWDTESGECMRTLEQNKSISVAFSPDGTKIASGSTYGNIDLWDVASGECLHTIWTRRHQGYYNWNYPRMRVGEPADLFFCAQCGVFRRWNKNCLGV